MANSINVLILGEGGREHAIACKIKESPLLNKLYVSPGNSGTQMVAENIPPMTTSGINITEIKYTILDKNIHLLIIGPEALLVEGIHDELLNDGRFKNLIIIGPKKIGAQLEGSKLFAKEFMQKYNIPTAKFKSFTKDDFPLIEKYLKTTTPPFVIKADGIAAGKGVFICDNIEDSMREIKAMMLDEKFGNAGKTIVIEEFLQGIELSVFILTNGKDYKLLPIAKDYKRIGEGDKGLNTGGMGAISPVPFVDNKFLDKIKNQIILPTLDGLQKENIEYSGFIFFGLINVKGKPMVIEYNARLGDPETQAVMPRIESDFLELLSNINHPEKFSKHKVSISNKTAMTIIITSGGYPETYQNGFVIEGLKKIKNSMVFHAGIKNTKIYSNGIYQNKKKYVTNGGRVLAITSLRENLQASIKQSYKSADCIKFKNMYFRKDLGVDLLNKFF